MLSGGWSGVPFDVSDNWFEGNGGIGLASNPAADGDYSRNIFVGNGGGASIGYSGQHTHEDTIYADNSGRSFYSNGGRHDMLGVQFIRANTAMAFGNRATVSLTDSLVQDSTDANAWVGLIPTQADPVTSSVNGVSFVGAPQGSFLDIAYRAGSGRVDLTGNYWDGENPNTNAWVFLDFIDLASLAVGDASGFLTSPNPDAPISVPSDVQAVSDGSELTVSWSAVPDSDVASYRVHYGLERDGWQMTGDSASEGATGFTVAGTSATLSGLELSQPWRITVTAVDSDADGVDDLYEGHESWFSLVVEP